MRGLQKLIKFQLNTFFRNFITLICAIFIVNVLLPVEANAIVDRVRSQNYLNGQCDIEELKFAAADTGENFNLLGDLSIELDNPFCSYFVPSFLSCAGAGFNPIFPQCTSLLAMQGSIYGVSMHVFNNAHICGDNWTTFRNNMGTARGAYEGSYKQAVKNCIAKGGNYCQEGMSNETEMTNKTYREFIYNGIEYIDNACSNPNTGENFQRYYMRGYEVANFACERFLPRGQENADEYQEAFDCCVEQSQNTICIQYETGDEEDDESNPTSYKFCNVNDSICWINNIGFKAYKSTDIEYPYDICARTWSLCPYNHNIGGGTYLCDEYTDEETTDGEGRANDLYGECRNFCQRFSNCTQVPSEAIIAQDTIGSPYFDIACKNFVGSSQNRDNYSSNTSWDQPETFGEYAIELYQAGERGYEEVSRATTIPEFDLSRYRGFTAPITQCMVETFRNVFFNRAGHSKCLNDDESISISDTGICEKGIYIYITGQDLTSDSIPEYARHSSIFSNLQEGLKSAVLVIIMLSVMFYGWKILLAGGKIDKTEVLVYLIKIGLVLYFVIGNAWKDFYFDAAYGVMQTASNIGMKIDSTLNNYVILASDGTQLTYDEYNNPNMDGCQFGPLYNPNYKDYGNKTYLATWDTFDCKIARYLSYGPEASAPNLIILLLIASFTGGLGIAMTIAIIIIGLYTIVVAIKALYFFIMCNLAMVLMIYISPVIITMSLFKRTAGIFQTWLRYLISFTLQPMVLFVYLTLLFVVMNTGLQGSALFYGEAPTKSVNCNTMCKNDNQIKLLGDGDECGNGWETVNPKNDSAICILGLDEMGTIPVLKPLGVTIYKLVSGSITYEKIIVLFKFAFLMFILSELMNSIPGIAAIITGGPAFSYPNISTLGLAGLMFGVLNKFTKKFGHIPSRGKGGTPEPDNSGGTTAPRPGGGKGGAEGPSEASKGAERPLGASEGAEGPTSKSS